MPTSHGSEFVLARHSSLVTRRLRTDFNVAKKHKTSGGTGQHLRDFGPLGRGEIDSDQAADGRFAGPVLFGLLHHARAAGEREARPGLLFRVAPRFSNAWSRRGEFVEWADVYGHLYGTAHKQLQAAQEAGQDILLDIDVQGHQQVRQRLPEAVSVFILPPSFQELSRRLRDRHSDAPEEIERRLQTAREEIAHWPEYDYLVVNDHLKDATQALRAIVRAARFRRPSQAGRVEKIIGNVWRITANGNTSEPG